MTASEMRPLGLGEMLDRAVTLVVRNGRVLMTIVALTLLPQAIIDGLFLPSSADFFRQLQRGTAPTHDQTAAQNVGYLLYAAYQFVFVTLGSAACCIALAADSAASVRQSFAAALRRWPSLLLVVAMCGGSALVALAVAGFGAGLVGFALAGLGTAARIGGAVLAILALAVAIVAVVAYAFVAQLAFVLVALGLAGPVGAVGRSFRWTFRRAMVRRTVLAGVSVALVTGAASLILTTISGLLGLAIDVRAIDSVITVLGFAPVSALVLGFAFVYVTDLRVRFEGYDLALAAESR